ncbi:hypothetical protein AZA_88437 [Nitrospirillum viridazoti Y2]|uniref:hypothetical protein n=1 Tax=Nitrospirillum viridazoti TaxID=3144925 RepID=UPI00022654E4|nr:hypothetical protein [Nitrospirillum amazonense]EGY01736.1 hypothetical protein AZA_88437 [Nitrospirillum amazonense Y2]
MNKILKRIIVVTASLIGVLSLLIIIFLYHIVMADSPGVFVEDADQAASVLAYAYLEHDAGEIYISINGHDPDEEIKHIVANKNVTIHNLSEIPECNVPDERDQDPSCGSRHILRARFIDAPAKYVAIVGLTTEACGGGGTSVKIGGKWFLLKHAVNCCRMSVVPLNQ